MNKRRNGARSMAERNEAIDIFRRGFLRAVFVWLPLEGELAPQVTERGT